MLQSHMMISQLHNSMNTYNRQLSISVLLTCSYAFQTFGSEEIDLNAKLHGNWTVENAKGRLHQFFQKERINPDYKYSQVGPDHNRFSFQQMCCVCKEMLRNIN